jgi:hypothetical protein
VSETEAARRRYLDAQVDLLRLLEAIQPPLTADQRAAAIAWWRARFDREAP